MAWKFEYLESAYYNSADWLDSVSQMSFAMVGQLDTVTVGSKQVPFGHYGLTNRAYFRKNNAATELMRWSVTSGGVSVTVDDTWTPIINDPHHWVLTWKKNTATSGIQLYRDGALIAQAATTTQTADYSSGGGIALYLGALRAAVDYWRGSLEMFAAWPGSFLTAGQIARLAKGFPWYQIGGVVRPAVWWDLAHPETTQARDYSGNARHLTSTTGGLHAGISYVAPLWTRQMPGIGRTKSRHRVPAAGPAAPNEWTLWETVLHPVAASTLTGLTNGTTYEVCLSSVDKDGNESAKGTLAEATPSVPAAPVVSYRIPWKRASRRSKYKKSQQ